MATETNGDMRVVDLYLYFDKEEVFVYAGAKREEACKRLLADIHRLLKPPAKREKGSADAA